MRKIISLWIMLCVMSTFCGCINAHKSGITRRDLRTILTSDPGHKRKMRIVGPYAAALEDAFKEGGGYNSSKSKTEFSYQRNTDNPAASYGKHAGKWPEEKTNETFQSPEHSRLAERAARSERKKLAGQLKYLEFRYAELEKKIKMMEKEFLSDSKRCLSIREYNKRNGGYIYKSNPPGGRYLLVLGEFQDIRQAKLLAFKLKENSLSVWLTSYFPQEQNRCVIYVGAYSKYEDAVKQGNILVNNDIVQSYSVSAGPI